MALALGNSFESGFFDPKGTSVLPDITALVASIAPKATDALRTCLEQCQSVEGRSPMQCQERCKGLTPGDTGECKGFMDCFVKGFKIPTGASNVMVMIFGAILVILAIVLITR